MFRFKARAESSQGARIDDLDYALSGFNADSLAVLRRSALDAAELCADGKERAQLFRSHGVLERFVVATSSASSSADPVFAVAVGGMLYALSRDTLLLGDESLVGPLASSLLLRLDVCDSANLPTATKAVDAELDAAWSFLHQLCPGVISAGARCPGSGGDVALVVRRLCILGLAACARASPEACQRMRSHAGLHMLSRIIAENVAAARPLPTSFPSHDELYASLAILEAASFPVEASRRGGRLADGRSPPAAVGKCNPGGRALALLPVIRAGERAAAILYRPAEGAVRDAADGVGRGAAGSAAEANDDQNGLDGKGSAEGGAEDGGDEKMAEAISERATPQDKLPVRRSARNSPRGADASPAAASAAPATQRSPAAVHTPSSSEPDSRSKRLSRGGPNPRPKRLATASADSPAGASESSFDEQRAAEIQALQADSSRIGRSMPPGARHPTAAPPPDAPPPSLPEGIFDVIESPPLPQPMRSHRKRPTPGSSPSAARTARSADLFDPHAFAPPAANGSASAASGASGANGASASNGSEGATARSGSGSSPARRAKPGRSEPGAVAARRLLGHALRTLVNLTHGSRAGCKELLAHGLPLAARVLSAELAGAAERGGLAAHFDTALMAVGLLTNCLEVCPDAAAAVGGHACGLADPSSAGAPSASSSSTTSGSSSGGGGGGSGDSGGGGIESLITLLSHTLRLLLAPPATAAGEHAADAAKATDDAVDEKVAMEREVFAAYLALLVGFLCRQHAPHATQALDALCEANFARVSRLLQSFLELQAEAHLISEESAATMGELVEWLAQDHGD